MALRLLRREQHERAQYENLQHEVNCWSRCLAFILMLKAVIQNIGIISAAKQRRLVPSINLAPAVASKGTIALLQLGNICIVAWQDKSPEILRI